MTLLNVLVSGICGTLTLLWIALTDFNKKIDHLCQLWKKENTYPANLMIVFVNSKKSAGKAVAFQYYSLCDMALQMKSQIP